MQFSTLLILPIVLAVSVLAGHNCKCQDSRGQNDQATETCCRYGGKYHADEYHQCSGSGNSLDNGAFTDCCKQAFGWDSFCWT